MNREVEVKAPRVEGRHRGKKSAPFAVNPAVGSNDAVVIKQKDVSVGTVPGLIPTAPDQHRGSESDASVKHGDVVDALRCVRAEEELLEVRRTQTIVEAVAAGLSQRDISRLLGVSQPTVHRMVRRAQALDRSRVATAREAVRLRILTYVAGGLTRGKLVGLLSDLDEGQFPENKDADGYAAGPWDEVRRAFMDDLIDENLYAELHQRHQERQR